MRKAFHRRKEEKIQRKEIVPETPGGWKAWFYSLESMVPGAQRSSVIVDTLSTPGDSSGHRSEGPGYIQESKVHAGQDGSQAE